MDQIVPFGDEKVCWTLAIIASAVVSRLNLLCEAWGAKDLPELKPKEFIPWKRKSKKKKKSKYVSPNAAAAAFFMAVNR